MTNKGDPTRCTIHTGWDDYRVEQEADGEWCYIDDVEDLIKENERLTDLLNGCLLVCEECGPCEVNELGLCIRCCGETMPVEFLWEEYVRLRKELDLYKALAATG